MASKIELAWAAGLWEGEGCFTNHKARNPTRKDGYTNCIIYPCASITMTDKDVLDRFVRIIGFGKVNGPYFDKRGKRKPKYQWGVVSKEAYKLIEMFRPFMLSRRLAKIEEVLSNCCRYSTNDPSERKR